MRQTESFSFEAAGLKDTIDPEKLFLIRNMLQLHYAEQKTGVMARLDNPDVRENDLLAEETKTFSVGFREWLNTSDGDETIKKYASEHTMEDIESFRDMDDVVKVYEAYHARTLH